MAVMEGPTTTFLNLFKSSGILPRKEQRRIRAKQGVANITM